MRLNRPELLCNIVLLKYKGDSESFWHRHQKGEERLPPLTTVSLGVIDSLISYYSESKEWLEVVKTSLDLLPGKGNGILPGSSPGWIQGFPQEDGVGEKNSKAERLEAHYNWFMQKVNKTPDIMFILTTEAAGTLSNCWRCPTLGTFSSGS